VSEQEYSELWHYSEQFTRDRLQRSELVTMVWKEGQRLGNRRTMGLMKSVMHFRSKELDRHSAFPSKDMGTRTLDAWNHERVYIDRPAVIEAQTSFYFGLKGRVGLEIGRGKWFYHYLFWNLLGLYRLLILKSN